MEKRDKKGLTEAEFLEVYKTKNYPKPMLTADMAIFSEKDGAVRVLLIRRGGHPFIDQWALPGGFANSDESVEETAARELMEETGITETGSVIEVGMFSKPGRDPRGWVVSDAFTAMVDFDSCTFEAADDAKQASWFEVALKGKVLELRAGDILIRQEMEKGTRFTGGAKLTEEALAFDHAEVICASLEKLGKI